MLAYILAILVGSGSVGLYIAAFFFPEIHRKNDFIWSGVGFFYALFLWIYARQITGGILVGQTTSVALIGWFVWQTVKLRRQIVPANQQTPLPGKNPTPLAVKPTQPKATPQPVPVAKPQPTSSSSVATPQPQPTAPVRVPKANPVTPPPTPPQDKVSNAPTTPTTPPKVETPPTSATPNIKDKSEDTAPWIELNFTPPPQRTDKPLGQAVQPPVSTPIPKPEVTRSVPSQPDAPLQPKINPEFVPPAPPEVSQNIPSTNADKTANGD